MQLWLHSKYKLICEKYKLYKLCTVMNGDLLLKACHMYICIGLLV